MGGVFLLCGLVETSTKGVKVKGKILGIEMPRDLDAILIGAGIMFGLLVVPGVSDLVYNSVVLPVRNLIGGKK